MAGLKTRRRWFRLTLDDHIAACIAEKSQIGKVGAMSSFATDLTNDSSLVDQAKIRLNFYDTQDGQNFLKRDHISRMTKLVLSEALVPYV